MFLTLPYITDRFGIRISFQVFPPWRIRFGSPYAHARGVA